MNANPQTLARWQAALFGLLALLVPAMVGYDIYYQIRTPLVDMALDWQTGEVKRVFPQTYSDYAGFWSGDRILSVAGLPIAGWEQQVGNYPAEVERNGQVIAMELVVLPLARLNWVSLASAVLVEWFDWSSARAKAKLAARSAGKGGGKGSAKVKNLARAKK